jgi:signal transduction histidine kinase
MEAGDLLEDMLTLARADEGRLVVNLVPLDLSELLDEVCDKVCALASAKNQMFTTQSGLERPVLIEGDRPTLRRLFWALLDNAVKYTPDAGRIEVDVNRRGPEILVTVRDSGIGIPKDMQPQIFERFFRADPSRAHAGGTGLGLAIAKWIADAHQASLSVQSEEGHGTTFEILLKPVQHHFST